MLYENRSKTHSLNSTTNHKHFGTLRKDTTSEDVSLSFNNWKLYSYDADNLNLHFFWVKVVTGDAIDENPITNLLQ